MARLLAVLLLALNLSGAGWAQDAAQQALQEGIEQLQAQAYEAAVTKLRAAIAARQGSFPEAQFQLGLAYFAWDKLPEAAAAFDLAAEQDPELASVQHHIAQLALFEPDYEKAVKAYEKYLDLLAPRDPQRLEALRRVSRLRLMALTIYESSAGDARLQILSQPKPIYPAEVKEHIVGDVIVEAIFTADGEIYNARVLQSLGPAFDDAALKLVNNLRFKPAMKQGKPVSQRQKFKLHYQRLYGN